MENNSWDSQKLASKYTQIMDTTARGFVRVAVLHAQLMEHLPSAPATVLDIGGGAGHQAFPLAEAGYNVTILDSDTEMLDIAADRRKALPKKTRKRITLVQGDGEHSGDALDNQRFDGVLSHGVLGYLQDPMPMVTQLCQRATDGGIVSIMTGNAKTVTMRPALERRWDDALASFDSNVNNSMGVAAQDDTVENISSLLQANNVQPLGWYGVWLFADLLEMTGTPVGRSEWEQMAAVELEASRRDPYRQMSRVFHLLGRKG
jgi:SAM-dependent methyltransferase